MIVPGRNYKYKDEDKMQNKWQTIMQAGNWTSSPVDEESQRHQWEYSKMLCSNQKAVQDKHSKHHNQTDRWTDLHGDGRHTDMHVFTLYTYKVIKQTDRLGGSGVTMGTEHTYWGRYEHFIKTDCQFYAEILRIISLQGKTFNFSAKMYTYWQKGVS